MPTLRLLQSSSRFSLYTVHLEPQDIPLPTARFRRHALTCGLPFLNTLTINAFIFNARHQFIPTA